MKVRKKTMTKAEIISRIIDRTTDPWTESPEDYRYAEPIDLDVAKDVLKQYRDDDDDCELAPEDRMPEEATPALYMEAYNCYIRYQQRELHIKRLANWIREFGPVCEYINDYAPTLENSIDLVPVDFLGSSTTFPFPVRGTDRPDCMTLIRIGQVSRNTFDPGDEYCWFDSEKEILHSTSNPFCDGLFDAEGYARFLMSTPDAMAYILDSYFDHDDIQNVFGCTAATLWKEVLH